MISTFKPARPVTWILTAAVAFAVCCLTFTRAADRNKKLETPAAAPEGAVSPTAARARSNQDARESLERRLMELEQRIRDQQQRVDRLRAELEIPGEIADGRSSSTLDSQAIRHIEGERISAEASAARSKTLVQELKQLEGLDIARLAQALPTAIPDTELAQLLRESNTVEAQRVKAAFNFGPEHTEVRSLDATVAALKSQINHRVEGVLRGLQVQIAAQEALAKTLSKQIRERAKRDAELAERHRPYFRAKRDLEILEKVRDTLMQQFLEQQYGPRHPTLKEAPAE